MDGRDWKRKRRAVDFQRKKHVKFFERTLDGVPGSFGAQETNLITIVYFCVGGLDLLEASDALKKRKEQIISFVYSLQDKSPLTGLARGFFGNLSDTSLNEASNVAAGGFRVGPSIATTFAALNVLLTLGDDLAGVDRSGIAQFLKSLQSPDGSFHVVFPLLSSNPSSQPDDHSEADMRFVFCACAISFTIGDWSGVDIPRTLDFIWRSRTYEGGFAQCPGAECHGGSTYCAVASLKLISSFLQQQPLALPSKRGANHILLDLFETQNQREACSGGGLRDALIRWCVFRQGGGFAGRANKPEDSCYSFWVGATLKLLNAYEFVDEDCLEDFCMSTQDAVIGGFAKWPSTRSDPLHTYLCLGGLSLTARHQPRSALEEMLGFDSALPTTECDGPEKMSPSDPFVLKPVNPAVNISTTAATHLLALLRHRAP
ncbi:Geranylgeranyl transferase type-1 subunit beta [Hypsibius exemplaris]|uniref:Geranylgeranyl transferase type-1 subunit beta n=1 Tax=Hypsibius exemplaris TaxID=2072580 RepID=A0A1W0WJ44_HYPEX|nr:Geranylgeranyl transferase type-1 subunit beta [Hypsibius exemplaris]